MSQISILAAEKSLRSKQLDSVLSMLNLNQPMNTAKSGSMNGDSVWKVLVYDQFGQEIIAPLLRIADLRENGVTVHMLLHSDRQPIPDVPAIYFVEPTHENVSRICEDMSKGLYESYYINFSSIVPRDLLEYLAQSSLQAQTYNQISQIYDQYLNYLCLEQSMFSLNMKDSYFQLNQTHASDAQIESYMKQIVTRLYSVFITTGQVPVIRAPRGNAAENVAMNLESRLRDHVRNAKNDAFVDQNGLPTSRPLLIILDRNMDLGTMLHHTWSYQCLVHDVFNMKSSRIALTTKEDGNEVRKNYDLDLKDFFWAKNASAPFPQMAGMFRRNLCVETVLIAIADVDAELTKYKSEVEDVTRKYGVKSLEEIGQLDPSVSAFQLKAAVSLLPAFAERKRTIDMHMNIATALLGVIKERSLDTFIVMEENVGKQNKATMMELISNKSKGTPEDKLRTFILFYLNGDNDISKADMAEYEMALNLAGCNLDALKYIKQIKSITKMTSMSQYQASPANKSSHFLDRFSSTIADNLNVPTFGGALDNLISSVKNILPNKQNLPILSIVNSLTESGGALAQISGSRGGNPDDEFMYLDPAASQAKKPSKGASRAIFQEVYVFIVGGGNYVEYQNLLEYSKSQPQGKKIIYGSTEICNAASFLDQLANLGKNVK